MLYFIVCLFGREHDGIGRDGAPAAGGSRWCRSGNWGDVKLYNGSFDATTYVGCSVTLDEAPAEGTVQVYYRNADQAAAYSGTYVSWANSENAVVSEDGKTLTVTFDADALGEDLTITELALQNMGSSSVTVTIKEVLILEPCYHPGNQAGTL